MTAPTTAIDIRTVDDPLGVDNPYWRQVCQYPNGTLSPFREPWCPEIHGRDRATLQYVRPSRDDLVHQYSWAITDPASVSFVAAYAGRGVVEIGAGAGYWAWQLAQRGIDVIAFDEAPPDVAENLYCHGRDVPAGERLRPTFHPVAEGNTRHARDFPDRVLFLCWPPAGSPMAAAALDFYTGSRLIYLGEGDVPDGVCASGDFFVALANDWVEVVSHRPVQWDGCHDWITVYDRKVSP